MKGLWVRYNNIYIYMKILYPKTVEILVMRSTTTDKLNLYEYFTADL